MEIFCIFLNFAIINRQTMELSKRKEAIYSSLSRGKMRERHGLFMVEGLKGVSDTLGRFDVEALVRLEDADISSLAVPAGVVVYDVREPVMKKISGLSTPSEILGIYRIPEDSGDLSVDKNNLYIMLDGIQDPGNLGTIIRTAHWFGIRKIFASRDTVDVYNPKTIQSTMGSLGRVDVCYCRLEEVLDANPEMPVYGTLLEGENIYKATLGQSGFIIMGNEGKGVSPALREKLTHSLLIPPYDRDDHSESLNVAMATGIVLSQFRMRDV